MAATDSVHPDQLKMFMTPREIMSGYQALDADRLPLDPRAGAGTTRAETTAGHANIPVPTKVRNAVANAWGAQREKIPPDLIGASHIRDIEPRESSAQLWERKATEATLPPEEYRGIAGGTPFEPPHPMELMKRGSAQPQGFDPKTATPGQWDMAEDYLNRKYEQASEAQFDPRNSLATRIANEGVQNPVHLSDQFGSEGRRQIAGGHHRLATAMQTRPDDLIPVIHHETFEGAKKEEGGYRYT